ncbi:MAG: hypothetical protein FJ284_10075 [Planctomycetes bacterium]|nr:hypothetical protein [Planctomycetota bacterium]
MRKPGQRVRAALKPEAGLASGAGVPAFSRAAASAALASSTLGWASAAVARPSASVTSVGVTGERPASSSPPRARASAQRTIARTKQSSSWCMALAT